MPEISEKQYDRLLDQISDLKASLVHAIYVIKTWQDPETMPWNIYFRNAPEMQKIRNSMKYLRHEIVDDISK